MTQTIQHKRITTLGYKPKANEIAVGEICINIVDGTIWTKMDNGTIKQLNEALVSVGISDVTGLQSALDNKVDLTQLGVATTGGVTGVATLDAQGKVPTAQLPSYVDDVVEFADLATLESSDPAETGKIYVTLDDGAVYRFTGTAGSYVKISDAVSSADQAAKLATARNINGTAFDGSQDITTTKWGTSRDVTIGSKTIAVDGSTAVNFTLTDIGAAAIGDLAAKQNALTAGSFIDIDGSNEISVTLTAGDGINITNDDEIKVVFATKAEAEAGAVTDVVMSPKRVAEYVAVAKLDGGVISGEQA